jgi:hypothetical protein
MSLLCHLGLHAWVSRGGEVLRDARGKILVQWQVCAREGCQAMRPLNKSGVPV